MQVQHLLSAKQEDFMDAKSQTLDDIIENPIADRPVCPYISDCGHFDSCNQPDLNYLRYIVEVCGYQFVQCQHYRARWTDQERPFGRTGLAEHAPRAGPT